jgi:hypothetical protein
MDEEPRLPHSKTNLRHMTSAVKSSVIQDQTARQRMAAVCRDRLIASLEQENKQCRLDLESSTAFVSAAHEVESVPELAGKLTGMFAAKPGLEQLWTKSIDALSKVGAGKKSNGNRWMGKDEHRLVDEDVLRAMLRLKKKCIKKLYPVPPLWVYYRITLAPCRLAGTLAGSPSPLCRHWNLHAWPYSPLVLFPDDTFLGEADVPDDLH